MAKPAVPALVVRDPRYAVFKVASTVYGQVRSMTHSSTANRDAKVANAIGDEEKTKSYSAPEYTYSVTMEVYSADDNDDIAVLLGYTALSAGASFDLDSTKVITSIKIEVYTLSTSSGVLEGTWEVVNFTPLSVEGRVDAGSGDHLIVTITGEATGITFTKPA